MKYYLITFANTHTAISAQKYLAGKIPFVVMPTLREVSDSCGISLKVETIDYPMILSQMQFYFPQNTMYKIYEVSLNESHLISSILLL